ncbi:ISL3 family transposase [Enterococcus faecium]|nr:ISL3 family transposase [Enterococcus faecium]
MPDLHHIKLLLGIKDKNIFITNVESKSIKNIKSLVVSATLSKEIRRCPLCKQMNHEGMIVKNGKKKSLIQLNKCANQLTYLALAKQRYHCRGCHTYFTANTYIVDRNCFIAKQVRYKILEELTEKQAMTTIAKHCGVSWSTVSRTLASLIPMTKVKRNWLPRCLLMDEFRSLKNQVGPYSFSCMDGDTGKLLDILPSRKKKALVSYFMQFERRARLKVKVIVTDMNVSYASLIKECFPKAKLVVDRFHIVKHLIRKFEDIRVRIMKSFDRNDPTQAKYYRQLKALSRLLIKRQDKLVYDKWTKWRNFGWAYLTESEVVDRLLSISDELRIAYFYYQEILQAFHDKEADTFFKLVRTMPNSVDKMYIIPPHYHATDELYIRLALELPYSNAKIENLHTHIKALKRVAYGFRSFRKMKTRIFLLNNLITYESKNI